MDRNVARTGITLGLFIGSGCAALLYEVVWFQQLGLVLGATSVSLAILLSSFMGGMCLGSLAYPKFSRSDRHPLRDYAWLEMLIGLYGLASLVVLPAVGRVYWWLGSPGTSDLPIRAIVALLVLLPPTMLMGATLPAVARGVTATSRGASRLGWFYGANTCGAVVGCLLAGLYLLRIYDVVVATSVAAGINLSVAVAAFALSLRGASTPIESEVSATGSSMTVPQFSNESLERAKSDQFVVLPSGGTNVEHRLKAELRADESPALERAVCLVIALSGLTALGAEVIWTRLLGLLLGPTVYTFSILLAVFLSGLALGSSAGAWLSRRVRSPGKALAVTQGLLLLAIPFAAFVIVNVLPHWLSANDPALLWQHRMARDLLRASVAMLPAAVLWGASFPFAVATLAYGQANVSRVVSRLYAANTLGAIVGAAGISLVVHPWRGSQFAQQLLTALVGLSAVSMWWCVPRNRTIEVDGKLGSYFNNPRYKRIAALSLVVAAIVAVWLVPQTPLSILASGNDVSDGSRIRQYLFVREGRDSSVAVAESADGYRCFHVAGRVEATNSPCDMRTQRLLGHLPAAAHDQPRKVLVIGCGSGMTAGAFLQHPTVEEIVLCEIEPAVVEANRVHFAEYNGGVLDDPKTRIVFDDARHFLATTRETFDIITTDPIHPWIRGSASLYTREFFELCRQRLNPSGVVTQWIPLYESNPAAVKCELATLLQVFPDSLIFNGENKRNGYDLVVVGGMSSSLPNLHTMSRRLFSGNAGLERSLTESGLSDRQFLSRTFVCRGSELADWLADADINRDRNLRLQYLAGLTPDAHTEYDILQELFASRRLSPVRSAGVVPLGN